uniref:Uncharacterized protein n=1 Tax=Anopheles farauti TaxID=69004 RepID=A0A182QM14_9DIPT
MPLQLLWTTFTLASEAQGLGSCGKANPNCTWFCEQNIPMVNRSQSGEFRTEYLFPLRYHPLDDRFRNQHSIFLTPGIQYHCLQLSVQCLRRHYSTASAIGPTLMMVFRCGYFVVRYILTYQSSEKCYELDLDHFAHRLRGPTFGCRLSFARPYLLLGDGYRYLMILYCLRDVLSRKNGSNGYWLFVNKRNTPQENREIMRQLALPDADFGSVKEAAFNLSAKAAACRCDIFQRYIQAVRQCNKPFLPPNSGLGSVASERLQMNDTKSEDGIEVEVEQLDRENSNWFVIILVVVGVGLGVTLCVLFMQFERQKEEPLGETVAPFPKDLLKCKFINVQGLSVH